MVAFWRDVTLLSFLSYDISVHRIAERFGMLAESSGEDADRHVVVKITGASKAYVTRVSSPGPPSQLPLSPQ